jgi:hypothetical protein
MEQFANTLDHENAESLRVLAQESHKENSVMRMLTEKGTNDAAAVKIITLITIIYLPTTVVSVRAQEPNIPRQTPRLPESQGCMLIANIGFFLYPVCKAVG